MNIVLITGDELRHRYVARKLSETTKILHVYFEKKANVHEKIECTDEQRTVISRHFESRKINEEYYFSVFKDVSMLTHSFIDNGQSNDASVNTHIRVLKPDAIVLFGSSIIREPLLSMFPNRIINLHLGLSPYYRGSGTNFWPLYYREPECVGATIHLATAEVDAGGMLRQVRPAYSVNDTIHDLGNKTIIAAANILPSVLHSYLSGTLEPVIQPIGRGKVFKRKNLTADSIVTMYRQFETGMMDEFMQNRDQRLCVFPIIE